MPARNASPDEFALSVHTPQNIAYSPIRTSPIPEPYSFGTIPYLLAYLWREPEKAI